MKEIKYVPKQAMEGGDFTGFVMVKLPLFDERYEMLDQMGLKADPVTGEMKTEDLASFNAIRKLVSGSLKFYQSVEMKHVDGREFKSKEDLLSEPDCDGILIDVAAAVSRGFKPGKN